MGPTGQIVRVLQLHPTRRCNLRCLHCYSSSAPELRDALELPELLALLEQASAEGYTLAGFSGGEPILYPGLRDALLRARDLGMVTTVTSNGMLLDERRVESLRGAVDLVAISVDGKPESHNQIRGAPRAFEKMVEGVARVREAGIPFGFIFTLTQYNLDELEWVTEFAQEQGAALLQIHPLEETGRAGEALSGHGPDAQERAVAYIEALRLAEELVGKLRIQIDLVDGMGIANEPERLFAGASPEDAPARPLSELVSPLVLEADGTLSPVQYGFPRRYALGNIREAPLRTLASRWAAEQYPAFRELCQRVFDQITTPSELPVVNWYDVLARHAVEPAQVAQAR